ncbi:MAG: B12-binding domain-containing radical SAM protein [Acidobacteriaceae bacterium]|nr:B12-binding domain-containing radical SAM protein [Acidobacteriaceae bacterium]
MLSFPILSSEQSRESFPPLGPNLNVLLVWPKFPPSFWGFEGVLRMLPEAAMTPPLGLITVAALCPPSWSLRLLDRAFDEIHDEDYLWADLVMVSSMHAQRVDTQAVLARARAFGKRTFLGGPWASSEPEKLLAIADHVLAGEAEDVMAEIAADLERGTARALYRVTEKPDMSRSPIPRFDLLRRDMYTSMPVQFSRGCPFQCEFCDIITIYGRRPRVKSPAQLIAELDTLRSLGWRNEVFVVDDNFIGNSKNALELSRALADWGDRNNRVFSFYTEASVDLADRPELMAAMVQANFMYVFLGIESPSAEALKSTRKFQNLRKDNLQQIRTIQENGLWVLAGFIVGFDSDDETIFEGQREFIERAAITWAMAGMLQAPPTTPLYDQMKQEGRLFEDSDGTSNFSAPNFRTIMPLPTLLKGLSGLLIDLYTPEAYFDRAFRSLQLWKVRSTQKPPDLPMSYNLRLLVNSMWAQGVCSSYRAPYWKFLLRIVRNYATVPAKLWMGSMILLAANHFLIYAHDVAKELATAIPASDKPLAMAATH